MSEQEWFNPNDKRPPDGVIVDTLNSAGQMSQLVLKGNMWWFADMSMYIYYVPTFWRMPAEPPKCKDVLDVDTMGAQVLEHCELPLGHAGEHKAGGFKWKVI